MSYLPFNKDNIHDIAFEGKYVVFTIKLPSLGLQLTYPAKRTPDTVWKEYWEYDSINGWVKSHEVKGTHIPSFKTPEKIVFPEELEEGDE